MIRKNVTLIIAALVVIVVGGYYVYTLVLDYFLSQYVGNFNTLVLQVGVALNVGLKNNYLASQTLSQAIALHCPDADQWPNCRSVNI